jgi:phosphatidylserine decarboxylase
VPIHDFHTYHGLENLKQIVSKEDPAMSEELMKALFPLRNKKIGETLQKIIRRFTRSAEYRTPMEWFTPHKFETFMEFFGRRITRKKAKEIESKAQDFSMTMPAECNVEAVGDFMDTSPILRLKKPTGDVVKDLEAAGITSVSDMEFISLKLLKCYYHRVHVPVDGTLHKITFVGKEEPLFGDNSLWIVEFDSTNGRVYLLVVGELSIQDFAFRVKEGDKVKKFDELGNFNWGSQVVVIYEKDAFYGDILIEEKETYFVGDGVFQANQIITPTEFGDLPDTSYTRGGTQMPRGGVIYGSDITGSPIGASTF